MVDFRPWSSTTTESLLMILWTVRAENVNWSDNLRHSRKILRVDQSGCSLWIVSTAARLAITLGVFPPPPPGSPISGGPTQNFDQKTSIHKTKNARQTILDYIFRTQISRGTRISHSYNEQTNDLLLNLVKCVCHWLWDTLYFNISDLSAIW